MIVDLPRKVKRKSRSLSLQDLLRAEAVFKKRATEVRMSSWLVDFRI
jgi:hypothetical protein